MVRPIEDSRGSFYESKIEFPWALRGAPAFPVEFSSARTGGSPGGANQSPSRVSPWRWSTAIPSKPRQPRPEQPIRSCQLRSLHRPLQNSELMTKGQNLKLKCRATAKESQEGRPQRYKWRRISKSKVVRQTSIYQQLRGLREPQWNRGGKKLEDQK